jgi:hypothetical protein
VTIHEQLAQFKPSEIKVQWLHEAMTQIKSTKNSSKVTFATDQLRAGDVIGDTGKPCMILWLDRDAVDRLRGGKP